MPTTVRIRGHERTVPQPASSVQYTTLLLAIVQRVRDAYLQLAQGLSVPETRLDDSLTEAQKLRGLKRRPLYNVLQNTDRSRYLTQHGIQLLVDSVIHPEELSPILDHAGHSILNHTNREFDGVIAAQSKGRPVKASIAEIDLRGIARNAPRLVEGFRKTNLDLITALVSEQVDSLETVLRENQGLHVSELTQKIQEATGASERHATLLARDQTLKLSADMHQIRAQNVGATSFIWVTSNDERVRGRPGGKWANSQSDHWSLNGRSFPYDDPPVTNPVTGVRNLPGRDFQCRCTASPDLSHIFGEDKSKGSDV